MVHSTKSDCHSVKVAKIRITTCAYAFSAQIPKKGNIYSVNEGNAKNWDGPTAKCVILNCNCHLFLWVSYFGFLILFLITL